VEQPDRRRVGTWSDVKYSIAKLLKAGIKVSDEDDVALSDVIERLGEPMCQVDLDTDVDTDSDESMS
jgi:hypothetical protein